jgi:hypothetical protein
MNQKKFDGPSFVNPSHTSQSLNQGNTYQTPKVNYSNSTKTSQMKSESSEVKNKKGPRGAWEDDFGPESQINTGGKKNSFMKPNQSIQNNTKSHEQITINNHKTVLNHNTSNEYSSQNYWDVENSKKLQNSTLSIEYETKLIDGILIPTGVTIKPSESQIKDFLKRLKTLNKQIVLKILLERLNSHKLMTSSDQIKVLQVSLNKINYFNF